MKEKAKRILIELKEKNKALSEAFDEYVQSLSDELEIPKDIAITLVTDELVNKYQKDLILRNLFSRSTLNILDKNNRPFKSD